MHRWMERPLVVALAATALLIPSFARARGDVSIALSAERVTAKAGGRETTERADRAKPGDVIEYRATYRNPGNAVVRRLDATLPIPAGTEYLDHTARPAVTLASIDGRTFAPIPLMRRVRLTDGREVMREVPASEYRWLRWSLGSLDSHGERSVVARVRVSPGPVATLTQR